MRAIGEEEFFDRWAKQHVEWEAIRDELTAQAIRTVDATGENRFGPSAWDVSHEQRKRALRDGRTLVTVVDGGFFEITPGEDKKIAEATNA